MKTFDTKEILWVHQNLFHSFGKNKVCPKCGKKFNKTLRYKIHTEYHKARGNGNGSVINVKKRFADVSGLERHAKSHFKQKLKSGDFSKRTMNNDGNKNGQTPSYPA